ncbi:MAG: SUMF1/EgtB/PvdO family nonheme iron enzyme [Mucilaginibacter polytrichastri]|nr:SUMF1/EgtB/PvdO family nonheme iron enzyme [Mucilaginibacter polytrichastri]
MNLKYTFTGLFVLSFSCCISTAVFAQQKFESYTQNIDGTKLAFDMVAVKGGEFKMGSPAQETGRAADEGPQHKVKISPFWIGKYEVPWDLFEPFVYKDFEAGIGDRSEAVDAVARPTKPYLDMTFGMGKAGFPAVGMTQYGAIQFCKWLYARTGVFYRLPTEAEWEYAARAGSEKAYSFGDDAAQLGDYAWFKDNSNNKTHPPGGKKPNAWGIYDMYGNVAEWTIDQYEPDYKKFGVKTAADPVVKPEKLYPNPLRGGSFEDDAAHTRSASRMPSDPNWKRIDPQMPKSNWWFPEAPFVGLRVVRPQTPPSKAEIEAYYNQKPIADI